mmetsp:Transcript_70634/g.202394  ORF Transcript_70634/g.202394 Transcript_70634/m.202394 type:complete len:238 (+) Transcript_70634:282-995(+)
MRSPSAKRCSRSGRASASARTSFRSRCGSWPVNLLLLLLPLQTPPCFEKCQSWRLLFWPGTATTSMSARRPCRHCPLCCRLSRELLSRALSQKPLWASCRSTSDAKLCRGTASPSSQPRSRKGARRRRRWPWRWEGRRQEWQCSEWHRSERRIGGMEGPEGVPQGRGHVDLDAGARRVVVRGRARSVAELQGPHADCDEFCQGLPRHASLPRWGLERRDRAKASEFGWIRCGRNTQG